MTTTETPAAAPVATPWAVLIWPDWFDHKEDTGYSWCGLAVDQADAVRQACAECDDTNGHDDDPTDPETVKVIDAGPDYKALYDQLLLAQRPIDAADHYAHLLRSIGEIVAEGDDFASPAWLRVQKVAAIVEGVKAGVFPLPKVQIVAVLDGGLLTMAYVHGIALDDLDFITLDTDTEGASPEDDLHTVTLDGEEFETYVGGPLLVALPEPFVGPDDEDAEPASEGMPEFAASATFADQDGERGSWDDVFKATTLEDARTTARHRLETAHPYATKVDMTVRPSEAG